MRITKNQLRQIIKEELAQTLVDEGIISSLVTKGKEIFGGGEPDTIEKLEADKAELERAHGAGEIDAGQALKKQKEINAREYKLKGTGPGKAFSADTRGSAGN